MSCIFARGLIVVAIVQRNRHVVHFRTRPYCRCHCATRPACRALAHDALSLSPVWQRDVRGFIVNFVDFVAVIVVVVAVARCNMKMPCACARGLVVDVCCRHRRSCCRRRRRATRRVVVRLDFGDQEAGTVLSVTNVEVCRKQTPAPASDLPGW
jgi:hypothetical protein